MKPAPLTPAEIRQFGDCVCFNFRWFSRLVTQHYDRRLRSTGVRITQLPILARLAAGPARMAELGDWLAMERTALLRTVRPLRQQGHVRVGPAATGRGQVLVLTPAGRRLLAKLRPEWDKVQAEIVAAFGADEWGGFMSSLERVAARLEQEGTR